MTEHKYSVAEIDRMRTAVWRLRGGDNAEDRLRTYMINGTSPAELEVAAEEFLAAQLAAHKANADARYARQKACHHDMKRDGMNFSTCRICGITKVDKP